MTDSQISGLFGDLIPGPGADFYRRSLFRNSYGELALSLVAIGLCIANIIRFWGELSTITIIFLFLVSAWICKLWWLVLRYHAAMHALHERGTAADGQRDPALGVALSVAANVTRSSLFSVSLVSVILLILFAMAMRGRA